MALATGPGMGGEISRRIRESAELASSYRGYVWSQWFRQNFLNQAIVFAALLGTGGVLSRRPGDLFTLSLPVSRTRLLGVRAATGLAEFAVLTLVPPLFLVAFSPAIGERYPVVDAMIHAACILIGGTVFFSLALLLSTVFGDVWRPLLLTLCVALAIGTADLLSGDLARFGLIRAMSAESYFRGGGLPWPGLVASAAISLLLLYVATRNIVRQDF